MAKLYGIPLSIQKKNRKLNRSVNFLHNKTHSKKYASLMSWKLKFPFKSRAHKIVYTALRNGSLKKQPCGHCGLTDAEAHHDNYGKPLEIMWLCKKHHTERHKYLRENNIPTYTQADIDNYRDIEYTKIVTKLNKIDDKKNKIQKARDIMEDCTDKIYLGTVQKTREKSNRREDINCEDSQTDGTELKNYTVRLRDFHIEKLRKLAKKKKMTIAHIIRTLIEDAR